MQTRALVVLCIALLTACTGCACDPQPGIAGESQDCLDHGPWTSVPAPEGPDCGKAQRCRVDFYSCEGNYLGSDVVCLDLPACPPDVMYDPPAAK